MMNATFARAALLGVLAVTLAACQTSNKTSNLVLSTKSPVELRAIQARAFDTTDRTRTLRAVVATLQDLGYGIEKIEPSVGTVSAVKLASLRMTATVYPRGQTQTAVRANALLFGPGIETQVDDPLFYQQLFFEPLSKAMFLSALQVDGSEDKEPAPAPADTSVKKP